VTEAGLSDNTQDFYLHEGISTTVRGPRFKVPPPNDEGNENDRRQSPAQKMGNNHWFMAVISVIKMIFSPEPAKIWLGTTSEPAIWVSPGSGWVAPWLPTFIFLQFYAPNWNIKPKPSARQSSAKSVPNLCIFAPRPLIRGSGIKTGLKGKLWPIPRGPTFSFTLSLLCCSCPST